MRPVAEHPHAAADEHDRKSVQRPLRRARDPRRARPVQALDAVFGLAVDLTSPQIADVHQPAQDAALLDARQRGPDTPSAPGRAPERQPEAGKIHHRDFTPPGNTPPAPTEGNRGLRC